jgi:hypothetical protein
MEGPIWVKELGDMALKMIVAQTSPKSDIFSSEVVLGILYSFPRKPMNTKIEDNFVAHNITYTPKFHYLESGRGRYGASNEGLRIRKIWTRLIL